MDIRQKQALSEMRTFLVQKLGLDYRAPLCLLIDAERDSMRPVGDPEQTIKTQILLEKIRSRTRNRTLGGDDA